MRRRRSVIAVLGGYAAPFDRRSADLGGYSERIRRGAFVLAGRHVDAVLSHRDTSPIASTSDGTLGLWQDRNGLAFRMHLWRGSLWDELAARVEAGSLFVSIRYAGDGPLFRWSGDGQRVREIVRAELDHIAFTAAPAFPGTAVWFEHERADDLPAGLRAARLWC